MNDNLPPLPPCAPEFQPRWPNDPEGYTADQMHAYAIAAIAAAPQPLTVAGVAVFQDAEGKRPVTAIGQPVGRWEPTPLFPPGCAGVFLERPQAQPLTHLQAKALVEKYGNDPLHLIFQTEAAHGIKGTT